MGNVTMLLNERLAYPTLNNLWIGLVFPSQNVDGRKPRKLSTEGKD